MNRRGDGAARLLGWAVRLLPAGRHEWGRAMEAELASLEAARDRRRFALTCTRAALTRPAAIVGLGRRLLPMCAVVGAVVLTSTIRPAAVRFEVITMILGLAAVPRLARRIASLGPVATGRAARLVSVGGFAVIATEVLIFVIFARRSPGGEIDGDLGAATTLIAIWTAMLMTYTIALLKLTAGSTAISTHTLATGAGVGVAAAAAWLAAAFADPAVPTSSGPAIVAIAAAAVCAEWLSGRRSGRGVQRRVAGLCAAAGTALMIAVLIDGPLRVFSRWVSNSAPPVVPPAAPERLVDSIGIWLLGSLLATALILALRPSPRRARESDAPVVLSTHVT